MEKTIKKSLVDIGRTVEWLADQLGMPVRTIYRRFKDERWELPELRRMKDIFKWKTLEG